jgi:hypothetical protein
LGISPIVGKIREAENDEFQIAEDQRPTDGIADLRKFEYRTNNLLFRNLLNLQDSINVRYVGMKLSLAQGDNSQKTYRSGKQGQDPINLVCAEMLSNLSVPCH